MSFAVDFHKHNKTDPSMAYKGVLPIVLHEAILMEEINELPVAQALVHYLTAVRVIPNQLECDRLIRNCNNRSDRLIKLLVERLKTCVDHERLLHVALVGRLRKGYLSELLHLKFTIGTEWGFLKRLADKISPLWCFVAKEIRVDLVDDVMAQNPTPASRSLHMLLLYCNRLVTQGVIQHHTELPKYVAAEVRRAIDLINPSRFVPRPGTVSLKKLHDSGFIDLDDKTMPKYGRMREFTEADLTRTVDDVRQVVTEELLHCPRDLLLAIEGILKVAMPGNENTANVAALSNVHNVPSARGNQQNNKIHYPSDSSSVVSADDAFVRMSAIHIEVLKRNHDVITEQLIYTLPVIDLLYSRGVMDIYMATELRQQASSIERGERLLTLMPRLPDEGFYTFCEGLASVGLESVAQRLRHTSKLLKSEYK